MAATETPPSKGWYGEVLFGFYDNVRPRLSDYRLKGLARAAVRDEANPVYRCEVEVESPDDRLQFWLSIGAPDHGGALLAGVTAVHEAMTTVKIDDDHEMAAVTEFITMNLISAAELEMRKKTGDGDDKAIIGQYDVGDEAMIVLSQLQDFHNVVSSQAFNYL
jgi:hypothetical protein